MTKQQFKQCIQTFDFTNLFNQLGWAHIKEATPIKAGEETFTLNSVAEKSGFRILVCQPGKNGNIPEHTTRLKIDSQVGRLFKEHLLIFINKANTQQVWQTVQREMNKPAKLSSANWNKGQEPELLYQKASGLIFTLDEEDNITIVDVTRRVAENFHQNNEKVTKQFYDRFKKEHTSFLAFIKGIDTAANKEWYASLMLNRLMFCYFIQKKGFLDQNKNYLRDKLKFCQAKKGKFYSFYRSFLLVLFHEGLNEPAQKEAIKIEIGKIPYLNGGLFDEHELEKSYEIDIDDKAFEKLFDFFDQYEWHLDTSTTATGKDINPDVIGYIFEKYINDRAQMGAYYTKEDITDYISKNCIIPWLFDETARNYSKAFVADGEIWAALQTSGDEYIYDAVKHGINEQLPKEVQAGIKDVAKRTEWNKPAPAAVGLPTEIWRETVERRKRYEDVKKKIEKGELTAINDFITYNLNIRKFTQDIIEGTNDADFLRHFYKALNSVTIIDPTCGSGAFLFAAMNILEPLYHACIMRMRGFTADEDRENEQEKKTFKNKYKFFREVLENIQSEQHPNLEYFIYKSIILNNLYGVDIMKEAVEIAKLRLFLKLVATVDADYKKRNLGLEPLPDIDFNIRAGNTLVGFATKAELDKGLLYTLDGAKAAPVIEEKCDVVAKAFTRYKQIQLSHGDDYKEFKTAKESLNKRLKELNSELNKLLHKQAEGIKYDKWIESYQPFHWFAEFYEIIQEKKGFDIIIGNPPYVVYTSTSLDYKVKNYETISCGNLYAFCCERSFRIKNTTGRFGMIIPNSSISADKLIPLQKLFIKNNTAWIGNYAWRPAKLFEGANMLLAIVITAASKSALINTTMYYKWYNDYRDSLFDNIKYYNTTSILRNGSLPKFPSSLYFDILKKLKAKSNLKSVLNYFLSQSQYYFYYFRAVLYWVKILDKEPVFRENGKQTVTGEMKIVYSKNEEEKYIIIALLSSTIYFLHYIVWSSCQVINSRDFDFPFNIESLTIQERKNLSSLGKKLQKDLQKNSEVATRNYSAKGRSFVMEKQYFYIKKSKNIIDEIDSILANYYEFTAEELDFIINYDIKYRMGKELEGDEEE